MQRLFIRGGWAGKRDPRFGLTNTGLPSRSFRGPFFFRFPIGERHTVFEWAMALADRHPYPHYFGVLFGDMKAEIVAGMRNRERAIALSDPANAIYRELKVEFESCRLDPLRREWCKDCLEALDFTRCVYSLDQVLPIVRRRQDTGRVVGKLLAPINRRTAKAGATRSPQRRGTYKGELASFMKRFKPAALATLCDDDIAQRFADYVEAQRKAGRSVLKLSQPRHVANQVAKLREKAPTAP
jgi:hypothetical protein